MTETIYLVVAYHPTITRQLNLFFKDKERALSNFAGLQTLANREIFTDDFGTRISIVSDDVGSVSFSDIAATQEQRMISELIQARGQAKTQAAAKIDPVLNGQGSLVAARGIDLPRA